MNLKSTKCAICDSFNNSSILFPQRIPTHNLDASP